MVRKNLFKVTIFNDDRTTIYIIADSKLDATFKYAEWLKKLGKTYKAEETTDFDIEFEDYVHE